MTPPGEKKPRMEISRWSLGLAVALLLASVIAVAILVPWLSPRSPFKKDGVEESEQTLPDKTLIRYRPSPKG
jgi:hypothetical protein